MAAPATVPASQTVHDAEALRRLVGRPLVPFFAEDETLNATLQAQDTPHEDVTVDVRQWNTDGYFETATGLRTVGAVAPGAGPSAPARPLASSGGPSAPRHAQQASAVGTVSVLPRGGALPQPAGVPDEMMAALAGVIADGQAATAGTLQLPEARPEQPGRSKRKGGRQAARGGRKGGRGGRSVGAARRTGAATPPPGTGAVAWSSFQDAAPEATALPLPAFAAHGSSPQATPPAAHPQAGAALLASLKSAAPAPAQAPGPAPARTLPPSTAPAGHGHVAGFHGTPRGVQPVPVGHGHAVLTHGPGWAPHAQHPGALAARHAPLPGSVPAAAPRGGNPWGAAARAAGSSLAAAQAAATAPAPAPKRATPKRGVTSMVPAAVAARRKRSGK